jgi:hypothetical protein
MMLKRLCQKAGIRKHFYFRLFRHSRATQLTRSLPEPTLKVLMGWSPTSKMASTYTHLSAQNVEDDLLEKAYNIKAQKNDEKIRVCPKCYEQNVDFNKICTRCASPLDEKALQEAVLSMDKMKELENWYKTFLTFLKVIEKKHPDIWKDMK